LPRFLELGVLGLGVLGLDSSFLERNYERQLADSTRLDDLAFAARTRAPRDAHFDLFHTA
jgi:hypothetical protein